MRNRTRNAELATSRLAKEQSFCFTWSGVPDVMRLDCLLAPTETHGKIYAALRQIPLTRFQLIAPECRRRSADAPMISGGSSSPRMALS